MSFTRAFADTASAASTSAELRLSVRFRSGAIWLTSPQISLSSAPRPASKMPTTSHSPPLATSQEDLPADAGARKSLGDARAHGQLTVAPLKPAALGDLTVAADLDSSGHHSAHNYIDAVGIVGIGEVDDGHHLDGDRGI